MKAILEKLKATFIFAIRTERQVDMFTGRVKFVDVPIGQAHLCEMEDITDEGGTSIEPRTSTICDIDRSKLGQKWKYSDKRPEHLPICPHCEQGWRSNPKSPWSKWVEGRKI